MTHETPAEIEIDVGQLRVGHFVCLRNIPWYKHPFLINSFLIRSQDQIETIRSLGLGMVTINPAKSQVGMPGKPARPKPEDGTDPDDIPPPSQEATTAEALWKLKEERIAKLRATRKRIAETERTYTATIDRVDAMMRSITTGNIMFLAEAEKFVDHLADGFLRNPDATLQLMNLRATDDNLYYHSLNVCVLSLMLATRLDMGRDELRDLALGALFHDIGKAGIEKRILRKRRNTMTEAERKVLHSHPLRAVKLLSKAPDFPQRTMRIIYQHHERVDGKGYPCGLTKDAIDPLAKIMALPNIYDNHVNHPDPYDSLTPYQALSTMFTAQRPAFQQEYLELFVKSLGVFPPGTIVTLSSGTIGMVVSVNVGRPLEPSVVIYDPEIPSREAVILDLSEEPDIRIASSIRRSDLAREVLEYLSPRTRVTYFVESQSDEKS